MSSSHNLSSKAAFKTLEQGIEFARDQEYLPDGSHMDNLLAEDFCSLGFETGIGLIAPEGRWIQVDDVFCTILGYSRAELLNKTLRDILHPDDWRTACSLAQTTSHTEENAAREELRFRHKQGNIVHVFFKALAAADTHQGSRYCIIQIKDALKIRQIRNAFHQYRLRQERYIENQALLKGITDVIIVRDAAGRCLRILPTQTHNLYRPPNELLGKTLHETLPRSRADTILSYIHQALDAQQPITGEYELIIRGKLVHFSAVFSPIEYDRVVIITHDVTELKKTEEQLAIHALITKNMGEGICLLRASDGVIVYTNPKFEQMFGYDFCELIGEPVEILYYSDTYVDPQEVARYLMAEIERHGKFTYEVHNVRKDGSPFWCRATTSVLNHPEHGTVYVAIQTDITEEKKIEANIKLLKSLSEDMRSTESFETSLNRILERVSKMHGWTYGEAWVPSSEDNVLRCSTAFYSCVDNERTDSALSASLTKFRQISETFTFPFGSGSLGRVWKSQKPEWQEDVSTQSEDIILRRAAAAGCGLKAGLAVPLIAEGNVLAVLAFFKTTAAEEDPHLVANLSAVAAQINLNTQRKQAKHDLSKAQALTHAVLQSMREAAIVVGENGRLWALNAEAKSLTGYEVNEDHQLYLSDIIQPLETITHTTNLKGQLQLGKILLGPESKAILTPLNGRETTVTCSMTAIRAGANSASVEYLAGAVIVIKPDYQADFANEENGVLAD